MPLAGVRLVLKSAHPTSDSQEKTAESGDDGSFAFRGVKAGSYLLTAEKEGYASGISAVTRPVSVAAGDDVRISISLPKTGSINGLVVSPDGMPLARMRVGVWTVSVRATPSILKPGKHDEVRE
jgi:hypothetical protein